MSTYNPLQLLPFPPRVGDRKPIPSAITADPFSDLIWVGTSTGSVNAFCDPLQLARNVRFPAHGSSVAGLGFVPGFNGGVREIRVTDRDVWTLTEGGVGGRRKGGQSRWSVTDPMRELRSMSPNPENSHELLVGGVGQMMLVNTSKGDVVRKFNSHPVVRLAPMQRTVLSAFASGSISTLDPRIGFRPVTCIQTHTGGISGADTNGHLVCTWGWTHMQGRPLPDPLVRLFDVRFLRAQPPITFPPTPAFCILNPNSSELVVASQSGTMQTIDLNKSPGGYQQLDASYITSMALSPLGDYLAFGDAEGQIHLWTTHDTADMSHKPPFNGYDGVKPEWPDEVEPPNTHIDEITPLNAIGMPRYTEPLLSNIPLSDYAPVTSPFFNPPEPVPPQILQSMRMTDMIGYAAMPRDLRGKRNVRTARPGAGKWATGKGWKTSRENGPRFRSEKERLRKTSMGKVEEETPSGEIPKYYRKVEIKYSKFGIEDFDFGYYNRTEYSGLETDILNSYTNSLLQALHYSQPIRAVAKAHICVDCKKEHCLLCEAGFLFRMLEDAKGTNCQASNFSRAFSATPQASALGLMDDDNKSIAPYGSLIQSFNRWLLSTFSTEAIVNSETFAVRKPSLAGLTLSAKESAIDQVLGIRTRTTNTCSTCDHIASREGSLHVIDLQYLRKPTDNKFTELLRTSLLRESSTKATCSSCKQFVPLASRRIIDGELEDSLPAVISVNAMVSSTDIFDVWRDRPKGGQPGHFLPKQIILAADENGEVRFSEEGEGLLYDVTSIVVQIQETPDSPAHLLSFVKMPIEEESAWVIFNDFLVRNVSEEEVFSFPAQWKVPTVIILTRRDSQAILQLDKLPTQVGKSVLFEDVSLAWNRRQNMVKHKLLQPDELPRQGTLIAIDAEFVALQQEEMEFRSDGTKNILRPSHMSLARVSVIRGEGEKEGMPFIDDYILTKEIVVDFLTEFSGIKHGDLDPNNSPHTLVPLKVAYKKLRLLVDLGCIFIGHGLAKDFRTISKSSCCTTLQTDIFVPPDQILDTVKIYTTPSRQRRLSLRFLVWFLLQTEIQTASHDSIEDAKYALMLYRAYLQFEEDGRFEDMMEQIFEEGQKVGFRPPHENRSSPANIPPIPNNPNPASIPLHPRGQRLLGPIPQSDNWRNPGMGQHPQGQPQQMRSMSGAGSGGRHHREHPRRRH